MVFDDFLAQFASKYDRNDVFGPNRNAVDLQAAAQPLDRRAGAATTSVPNLSQRRAAARDVKAFDGGGDRWYQVSRSTAGCCGPRVECPSRAGTCPPAGPDRSTAGASALYFGRPCWDWILIKKFMPRAAGRHRQMLDKCFFEHVGQQCASDRGCVRVQLRQGRGHGFLTTRRSCSTSRENKAMYEGWHHLCIYASSRDLDEPGGLPGAHR